MNVLLDTHAFIGWVTNPEELSAKARKAIEDPSNTVFISAAVIWEIVIKSQLGKLDAPENLLTVVFTEEFIPLAITQVHAMEMKNLANHHNDPFDRIQIAQAKVEGFTLITHDKFILKYDTIKTLKA